MKEYEIYGLLDTLGRAHELRDVLPDDEGQRLNKLIDALLYKLGEQIEWTPDGD